MATVMDVERNCELSLVVFDRNQFGLSQNGKSRTSQGDLRPTTQNLKSPPHPLELATFNSIKSYSG
jgi:hypothetical protein